MHKYYYELAFQLRLWNYLKWQICSILNYSTGSADSTAPSPHQTHTRDSGTAAQSPASPPAHRCTTAVSPTHHSRSWIQKRDRLTGQGSYSSYGTVFPAFGEILLPARRRLVRGAQALLKGGLYCYCFNELVYRRRLVRGAQDATGWTATQSCSNCLMNDGKC